MAAEARVVAAALAAVRVVPVARVAGRDVGVLRDVVVAGREAVRRLDRKSTRLNSSHT